METKGRIIIDKVMLKLPVPGICWLRLCIAVEPEPCCLWCQFRSPDICSRTGNKIIEGAIAGEMAFRNQV